MVHKKVLFNICAKNVLVEQLTDEYMKHKSDILKIMETKILTLYSKTVNSLKLGKLLG